MEEQVEEVIQENVPEVKTEVKEEKHRKSFSLKISNIEKVERMAYESKVSQSSIVDKMIEVYDDGSS